MPRNRQVAEILYYAGLIEQWGGGTRLILDECKAAGMPEPVFEQVQGFRMTLRKASRPSQADRQAPHMYPTCTPQVPDKHGLLEFCATARSIKEMLEFMGLKDRVSFMRSHLHPLLREGALTMTDPGSPRSPRQRYVSRV